MLSYYGPDSGLIDTQFEAREESGLISEKYCTAQASAEIGQEHAKSWFQLIPSAEYKAKSCLESFSAFPKDQ